MPQQKIPHANNHLTPTLFVSHLKKSYDEAGKKINVLCDVSFEVTQGEWIAIMGSSGSGKTTLIHLIGLLDQQDGGTILFDGIDTLSLTTNEKAFYRSNNIGIVFQAHYLVPTMTVKENIELAFVWTKEKLSLSEMRKRTRAVIELAGLEDRMNNFPVQLSIGEMQRAAIARALVNRGFLLLLDEPTGNLDVKSGKVILNIFRRIHEQGNTSLIMVTHDSEAAKFADRILLLNQGRIQQL